MYLWSSLGFMIRFVIPQFIGICALVYFFQSGNETFFDASGAVSGDAKVTMRAMPVFLGQLLPMGIIGLVAAGMIAAFMSTHDTYLLCWASVLTEDVVNPSRGGMMSQRARLLLTRVLLFVIAGFLVIWGLWYELGQDLWDYMAVSGSIYFTGAFAILLLGIYWKGSTATGAFTALSIGLLAVVGLKPVQELLDVDEFIKERGIGSEHIGLSLAALALVAMVVVSLLTSNTGRNNENQTTLQ